MDFDRVVFSGHAIRQMFLRGLKKDDILKVVTDGEVIIDYPYDKPYSSSLILGFAGNIPIHVFLAMNVAQRTGIVVTAYIPDKKLWTEDFKTRRTQ